MAKKNKLTQGQQRRIRTNHDKRLKKPQVEWDESLLLAAKEGVVISRFGQHADIEDCQTQIVYRCNLRRSIESLVTGDRVSWRPGSEVLHGIAGVVEGVHERRSMLTRPDYYDGVKPIAANIDLVVIVAAILPELSTNIIDRYLIACEQAKFIPLIVINKIDLLDASQRQEVEQTAALYTQIGYQVLLVSQLTGEGLSELEQKLANVTSVFVGQSGVGKSSLVNALLPKACAQTQEVSQVSGLGQHTTTTAKLYHFANQGRLIDSPGVREFGLWDLDLGAISQGFLEFHPFLGGCKFRDCKHLNDPGCLLQEAVVQGKISPQRFASYHKIVASMNEMKASRHFAKDKNS
ncbi:MAG: small ribosomal subunit biogenesis GTPase RsgA [Enterovibrio sp.]